MYFDIDLNNILTIFLLFPSNKKIPSIYYQIESFEMYPKNTNVQHARLNRTDFSAADGQ